MHSNVHIRQKMPNWLSIGLALLFAMQENKEKVQRPKKDANVKNKKKG